MTMIQKILAAIVAVAIVLALLSLYTVRQGQAAIMMRLGKLVENSKTHQVRVIQPGLHLKMPFVNQVEIFDMRLRTLDVESSRIMTAEQKYVLVDYYVKWRIQDLALYYKRTGGFAERAQLLLEQKINDSLRASFGRRQISEVIAGERLNIMQLLKENANQSAKGLGLQVADVRIKRIDLPSEVSDSVYQRMRTEREQVATMHRAQGQAQAEALRAKADAGAAIMVATAKNEAAKVRAAGDEIAAKIYNATYSRDASFYELYRSLEAYKQVLRDKGTVMVLNPKSDFFQYFNRVKGGRASSAAK